MSLRRESLGSRWLWETLWTYVAMRIPLAALNSADFYKFFKARDTPLTVGNKLERKIEKERERRFARESSNALRCDPLERARPAPTLTRILYSTRMLPAIDNSVFLPYPSQRTIKNDKDILQTRWERREGARMWERERKRDRSNGPATQH